MAFFSTSVGVLITFLSPSVAVPELHKVHLLFIGIWSNHLNQLGNFLGGDLDEFSQCFHATICLFFRRL
ncbi:hypothetical protein NQ317_008503 [Molorchus minor]|uniref:Uncharacterized protein n=1 Tax=Molorchus minor TaxID=1323400 RepID=A0ABQ9JKZ4_9CUCU|nr:hypothetical protein NQ317_008503 [Molorchus minor]